MDRRRFLKGAAAVSSTTLIPSGFMVEFANAEPSLRGACFDLSAARSIVQGQSLPGDGQYLWLDLSTYSEYTQDALSYLAGHIGAVEGVSLGFRYLLPEGAATLSLLRTPFFLLTDLDQLDAEAASNLKWAPGAQPICQVIVKEALNEGVANILAHLQHSSILDISVPSISLPVAESLSRHNHRLYLSIRDRQLDQGTATALAYHAGHMLTIIDDNSDEFMSELSSNPLKDVWRSPHGINVADVGWIVRRK